MSTGRIRYIYIHTCWDVFYVESTMVQYNTDVQLGQLMMEKCFCFAAITTHPQCMAGNRNADMANLV